MWNLHGVVVFHRSMVDWRRVDQDTAFCYMLHLFGVVVFHTSMVNWRMGPWNMCILLYVKLRWCSSIPYIYGQLERGTSALSICGFCYMWNLCGEVGFHRSVVNSWRGVGHLSSVCTSFEYMSSLHYTGLFYKRPITQQQKQHTDKST